MEKVSVNKSENMSAIINKPLGYSGDMTISELTLYTLAHSGVGHLEGGHSGRYPWGSGDGPRQRETARTRGLLDNDDDLFNLNEDYDYVRQNKRLDPESIYEINSQNKMQGRSDTRDQYRNNCTQCSAAYVYHRITGERVVANGDYDGEDFLDAVKGFNNTKQTELLPPSDAISMKDDDFIKSIPDNSFGLVFYDKDESDNMTYIDCQNNEIFNPSEASDDWKIRMLADCSESTIWNPKPKFSDDPYRKDGPLNWILKAIDEW